MRHPLRVTTIHKPRSVGKAAAQFPLHDHDLHRSLGSPQLARYEDGEDGPEGEELQSKADSFVITLSMFRDTDQLFSPIVPRDLARSASVWRDDPRRFL